MIYINKKKHSHGVFYVLLSLLLTLCVIRYSLQIDIPQVVFLVIAVVIALWGDQDEIIALCMCCIPLHTSFEYAYAILFSMLIYAVKYGRKIKINRCVIPVFLMILWETIHCFGQSFSIVEFVGRCVPLLLIALLMCSGDTRFDYRFIVRAFAVSIAAMCCVVIGKLLFIADFNLLAVFSNLQRLGILTEESQSDLLVSGGEMNPNTLGIMCVLGLTGLLQIRNIKQGTRGDLLIGTILIAFGMMTSSRTFLVCLALMALLLLFSQRRSVIQKVRFLCSILVVLLVVIFVLYLVAPTLLEYYISRFQEKDLTTGRLGLMDEYQEFILSNFNVMFFGIGLHDFTEKVLDIYQVAINTPHNGIQEVVIAWGLPGLALFVALWFTMIRRSRELCRNQGLINYIPLIILLAKVQAGQMLNSEYTMLTFSFAYLSQCANLTEEARARSLQVNGVEESLAEGLDLVRAMVALWKKRLVIVAVTAVCAIGAFAITTSAVTPTYQSSVMFYVNNNSISASDITKQLSLGDISASRSLVDTYSVILKSREALNQVKEYAGSERTYDELKEMVRAFPVNDTEIFKVVVTSASPFEAERIASAIGTVLPDRISEIIEGTTAKIVDYAVVAARPSSPSRLTNTMLGFIFGFVGIVMILLLQAMKDTTIRTEDDLADMFPYPVLAVIPDGAQGRRRGNE